MQSFHVSAKADQSLSTNSGIRFRPAMHLCSGDPVGAFVDTLSSFEERPVFLRPSIPTPMPSVLDWVTDRLGDICLACTSKETTERPIVLPLPAASLGAPGLAARCSDTISTSRLCAQEISLELTDAALTASSRDIHTFIRTLRQRGFRVSIDARTSWSADLSGSSWLMIDTLRIETTALETDTALMDCIDIARAAGVAIVAERPLWRDGDYLAGLGIEYGLAPRTDA